jgi:anti-sigma regulatory factor (Ser/Thr protein kinase)
MGAGSDTLRQRHRAPDAPGREHTHPHAFHHEAIFHVDGAEGFVRETLPLIQQALEAGAPVMVAVGEDRITALREALGGAAEQILFADMRTLGTNPARIIPAWRDFLDAPRAAQAAPLGIGEPVWPGREEAELDECVRHESLLNLAFARGIGWRLLCPYDLDRLDDDVLNAARHSHPYVTEPRASGPNNGYSLHGALALDGELERPCGDVWEIPFARDDLGELRHLVTSWACREAMPPEPAEDLVLAVDEIASNSIRHGGGTGMLRLWRDGERLVCEVQDRGRIEDPLIGRVQPGSAPGCGRGMWIANQLCDLVQIRSSASGSQVRLHKRLA